MTDTGPARPSGSSLRERFDHDRFVRYRPWLPHVDGRGPAPASLCVLLGSADISGGTNVIFRHAREAARRGIDVTIGVFFEGSIRDANWFPGVEELRLVPIAELSGTFDLVLATWWRTVYELPKVKAARLAYFVQSVESRFYGDGSDDLAARLAERTYEFGLPAITITRWLQAYLGLAHGEPSFVVRNGIDKAAFNPHGPVLQRRDPARPRILVEGPIDVAMKNVPAAIDVARTAGFDDVWLLTASDVDAVPGVSRVVRRMPADQVGAVYRSCDILLKLTYVEGMFGPPLEMFHCGGTAVVSDVTGQEEYLRHGENGLVVPTGDVDAAVDALRRLREERGFLQALQLGALRTASRWPDWDASAAEFGDVIEILLRQEPRSWRSTLEAIADAGRPLT